MFRESKLGKNEDPEIWINYLEDLWVKLEVMAQIGLQMSCNL
jgi:hypothetical protein